MPTSDPTQIFVPGDVVKVPFPYTDRSTRRRRPALIVSSPVLQRAHGLSWVLMITSAANRGWEGDVEIVDLAQTGLPAASVVRSAAYLGRVTPEVLAVVHRHLSAMYFSQLRPHG